MDYSKDEKVKEFTQAAFNPTGETAIVGNFNRFYVYNYNSKRPQWDEICCKQIENYYSVTSVAWKFDSSKIGFGSLCGSVDVFDVCLKKAKYKGKFDAITAAGILAEGHLTNAVFDEMLLALKKGGYAIFTTRQEYLDKLNYRVKIEELVSNGSWKEDRV